MTRYVIRILYLSFLIIISIAGCSASEYVILPSEDSDISSTEQQEENSYRSLWGLWNFFVNPVDMTATAIPQRIAEPHFNITGLIHPPNCDDCIEINVNSFDPVTRILDVDVLLRNSLNKDGYDVRGILYTDDAGHLLTNPDNWTDLYDLPGGRDINPFKAYNKDDFYRSFPIDAEFTENYLIYIPIPPEWNTITFAVDACWPGNCIEPFQISDFFQAGHLYDYVGAEVDLHADVRGRGSWHGTTVQILAPEITGEPYTDINFRWYLTSKWNLINNTGAPPGEYEVIIRATKENANGVYLYEVASVEIEETPEDFGWARSWNAIGDDYGNDVVTDADGNSYVTGQLLTYEYEHWPYFEIHTSAFARKYNKLGVLQWDKEIMPGAQLGSGSGIAFNASGEIYFTGYWAEAWNDNAACYLCKHDQSGEQLWAVSWGAGNTSQNETCRVDTDGDGNAYVCGMFYDTIDLDPGPGEDFHTSMGHYDIFVSSFDDNGDLRWAVSFGGTGLERGLNITTDSAGNSYIGGTYRDTVDFDPDPETEDIHTSEGFDDSFLCKFNGNGDLVWARTWGGASDDSVAAITLNESLDLLHLTGTYTIGTDLDPGPGVDIPTNNGAGDIHVSRFDTSGNYIWAITWGGTGHDTAGCLSLDNDANIIMAGNFMNTVDFDPGPGVSEFTSWDYYRDMFVSKFDQDGIFQWARKFGDNTGAAIPRAMACDDHGNILTTGTFHNIVDFDRGPLFDEHMYKGAKDVFLLKILPNGLYE